VTGGLRHHVRTVDLLARAEGEEQTMGKAQAGRESQGQ